MDTMQRQQLKEAKRRLYALLLAMKPDEMTDVEVDLQYQLAQDHQIREVLNSRGH